jgi:predicted ArsR family transcriptional regulator
MTCQGFCSIELQIFRNLLGSDWHVERHDHLITGARRCAYRIVPTQPPAPEAAKEEGRLA